MSDEPTKYVLKEPVSFTFAKDNPYDVYVHFSKSKKLWFDRPTFERLFVPVSDLSRENQPHAYNPKMQDKCIVGTEPCHQCSKSMLEHPVSVASENLKQQIIENIERDLHRSYLSLARHCVTEAPSEEWIVKESRFISDVSMSRIVDKVLELIQRSKECRK